MTLNFPGLFADRGLIEDLNKKAVLREDLTVEFVVDATVNNKVRFNWGKVMVMC